MVLTNENCVMCIGYSPHWVSHAGTFRIAKKRGGEVLIFFGIYILTRLSPQAYDDSKDLTEAINYKSNNIDNLYSGSWLSNLNESWPVKKNLLHLLKSLPSKIYFP